MVMWEEEQEAVKAVTVASAIGLPMETAVLWVEISAQTDVCAMVQQAGSLQFPIPSCFQEAGGGNCLS